MGARETEALAYFVCRDVDRLLTDVSIEHVKLHCFDTLVALLAARELSEYNAVQQLVWFNRTPGEGSESICTPPIELTAPALATLIRSTELDDIHLTSCTTPGSVAFSVAFTLLGSFAREAQPIDFLAAVAAGYETMIWFGKAVEGPYVVYRHRWPTLWGAPVAAAAVTARLLRLDVHETAHGLSIAAASTTPVSGHDPEADVPARGLRLGMAVSAGIFAVLASAAGFRANLGILGDLLSAVSHGKANLHPLPSEGQSLHLGEVSIKLFPSSRQAAGAVVAMLRILEQATVPPHEVKRISISVPTEYFGMLDQDAYPTTRLQALTNVRYLVARALCEPTFFSNGGSVLQRDDAIQEIMRRVKVSPLEDLSARYPVTWPAQVELETQDGQLFRVTANHVPGDPAEPASWDQVMRKARAWTSVPEATIKEIGRVCMELDEHWDTFVEMIGRVIQEMFKQSW